MSLRGINHIVLKVKDLRASDHFYREVLGMQRVGERPGMWPAGTITTSRLLKLAPRHSRPSG